MTGAVTDELVSVYGKGARKGKEGRERRVVNDDGCSVMLVCVYSARALLSLAVAGECSRAFSADFAVMRAQQKAQDEGKRP